MREREREGEAEREGEGERERERERGKGEGRQCETSGLFRIDCQAHSRVLGLIRLASAIQKLFDSQSNHIAYLAR